MARFRFRHIFYRHRLAQAVAALVLCCAVGGPLSWASTTERIISDPLTGLAIYGFDPVCYFFDGAALQGSLSYEYRFSGVTWRFRNVGNRAAFAKNPDFYIPSYGGYDPIAVGRGAPVAGDPQLFVIAENRLFLFRSSETRAQFLSQVDRSIMAAETRWPNVRRQLVP